MIVEYYLHYAIQYIINITAETPTIVITKERHASCLSMAPSISDG